MLTRQLTNQNLVKDVFANKSALAVQTCAPSAFQDQLWWPLPDLYLCIHNSYPTMTFITYNGSVYVRVATCMYNYRQYIHALTQNGCQSGCPLPWKMRSPMSDWSRQWRLRQLTPRHHELWICVPWTNDKTPSATYNGTANADMLGSMHIERYIQKEGAKLGFTNEEGWGKALATCVSFKLKGMKG